MSFVNIETKILYFLLDKVATYIFPVPTTSVLERKTKNWGRIAIIQTCVIYKESEKERRI